MPPSVLDLARRFRADIEAQDISALSRVVAAYRDIVNRLEGDIDALAQVVASGEYTAAQVRRMERYTRLIEQASAELERYQGFLGTEIRILSGGSVETAVKHARALMQAASLEAGIVAQLQGFPSNAILAALGFLADDGPLYSRLKQFAGVNTDRLIDTILSSIARGYNPRKLARIIVSDGFGMPLTDALRMARTAQIYSYREASRANYYANSNVVTGWVWFSALIPGRTCMSCVNKHGTEHGLDETLNDHHNGLCTMVPMVGGVNPVVQSGQDWFSEQGEDVQKSMMGAKKYTAWKDGRFEFDALSRTAFDEVYGDMWTETPLKDLVINE